MKKYLLLLPALALLGAGCATSTTVETTADAVLSPSPTAEQEIEVSAEQETVVTTQDGAEVTFETETSAAVGDDGVPTVDIVLGGASLKLDMEANNFSFAPKTIEAKPGEKIQITFTKNVGFHTFVIDEISLKHAVKQGEALSFTAPKEPGSYTFYCDIGSHRAQGMEGTLIVK